MAENRIAPELRKRAIIGVSWNLVERLGVQGITFILGIILARLLSPQDYGLIGMIIVFFAVAQVFVTGGFGEAYVQKKAVTQVDANTVFYSNLVISLIFYGVLWFSAPAISRFYDQPLLVNLTRVMAFIIIIEAFNIIQQAQVRRNLDFKRKSKITLIAAILSGMIGIVQALLGQGVWALVGQRMSNTFFIAGGLWVTSRWRPGLAFSISSAKNLFGFGSWVLSSAIIQAIFDNIYKVVIGKFYSAAQLGFYTKAKTLQQMGSNQLTFAVSSVSFPVFSKLQDDKNQLQKSMRDFLKYSMVLIVPLLVTTMVIAKPFVLLLLTEKWAPMIPFLQLLCIVGVFYPLQSINVQVLLAQGKSKLNFNLGMIKNVLRILNILLMYRLGIIYIIMGEVALSLISLALNTWYTKKFIHYGLFRQLNDIKFILGGAATAGLLSYLVFSQVQVLWVFLLGGMGLSLMLNIIFQYTLDRPFFRDILHLRTLFVKG